jgi:hypothetical protein
MTLGELYRGAIEVGMDADMRGRAWLETHMAKLAAQYEQMSERDQRLFDTERLSNPFGDTRIAYGDPDTELNRVIIGIDIGSPEVLLAAELARRGKPVDLVISHHNSAIGRGRGSTYDTAIPQVAMAVEAGVPEPRAWKLVTQVIDRIGECSWNLNVTQVAEALQIPLMTIHSPSDACVHQLIRRQIAHEQPETVGDVAAIFEAWEECQMLIDKARMAPYVYCGNAKAPVGKAYSCRYGGWGPTPEMMEELCKAGVGTFIMVGCSQPVADVARKYGASIVVIPHYPGDNIGINIMLDRIMPDKDEFDIVETSNYMRYRRA